MQTTMQALETFRRNRVLDAATADDDKVTPVYRLDEISEMLLTSPSEIVKDMVDYIAKRLDNKSPYVKQKTLRLIKYCTPKSGKEFKREVQRHAGAVRALFHYKGQPDPLKGDAPNKAVRDMAHEAIQVVYHQEDPRGGSHYEGGGGGLGGGGGSGGGGGGGGAGRVGASGKKMQGFGSSHGSSFEGNPQGGEGPRRGGAAGS
eukprot:jgi/Mesen1/10235/ME000774S09587